MKDLIIGAYTNYDWSKIKFWANSVNNCGFTGDKAVVVYNSNFDAVQRLSNLGFKISAFKQDPITKNLYYPESLVIVVQRFLHLWAFVNSLPNIDEYRYVITTDVKDVVFQNNPSDWLTQNMGDKKICASTESLKYKDEPWGNDNFKNSYPMFHNLVENSPIWNCGVQAGEIKTMKDLWLQIYLLSQSGKIHNPDQAAYNFLLNLEPWKSITKFTMSEDAWASQVGTTVDPLKITGFRTNLLEPEPLWLGGRTTTSKGIEHAILHQWDRIPSWKNAIDLQYGQDK